MKRIFVLNGHPAERSLTRALAETYAKAARDAGHEVRVANLHDLSFDSDFGRAGYAQPKPLEPDLEQTLQNIAWAEHIVLATPMWWGGLPAKLKGLIDRAFLPGRAFDTRVTRLGMPTPMLGGRSARVIVTSDTPSWFLRLVYKNALFVQIRGQIFALVGIRPTRFTYFSGANHPKAGMVERWIEQTRAIGAKAT